MFSIIARGNDTAAAVSPFGDFSVNLMLGSLVEFSECFVGINAVEWELLEPDVKSGAEHAFVSAVVACMRQYDCTCAQSDIISYALNEVGDDLSAAESLWIGRGVAIRCLDRQKMTAEEPVPHFGFRTFVEKNKALYGVVAGHLHTRE